MRMTWEAALRYVMLVLLAMCYEASHVSGPTGEFVLLACIKSSISDIYMYFYILLHDACPDVGAAIGLFTLRNAVEMVRQMLLWLERSPISATKAL